MTIFEGALESVFKAHLKAIRLKVVERHSVDRSRRTELLSNKLRATEATLQGVQLLAKTSFTHTRRTSFRGQVHRTFLEILRTYPI